MSELSPSGGSEGYGTCDDEVHKCALVPRDYPVFLV